MEANMTQMREQREKLNMTQEAVARACGVSLVAYQQWERGISKPAVKRQQAVITLLHLPANYFEEK